MISPEAYSPDGIKRLEDLGVTDVILGFRNSYTLEHDSQTLDEKLEALQRYADRVILKSR